VYIPSANAEHRLDVLHRFIESNPLGSLVTASPDGMFATHLPLVLDRGRGPHGTLLGHVARANPHHRMPSLTAEALVIFTGPDAYVTPSWYPSKREHGKTVPTWNYVVVHAYGTLRWIADSAWLRAHLDALTRRHESGRAHPWAVSDAPPDYVAQQILAIVGLELELTRIEGKWKMSQNRSSADIDGVVQGLAASDDPTDNVVSALVEERRPRTTD
jgi:transcriptional regulator